MWPAAPGFLVSADELSCTSALNQGLSYDVSGTIWYLGMGQDANGNGVIKTYDAMLGVAMNSFSFILDPNDNISYSLSPTDGYLIEESGDSVILSGSSSRERLQLWLITPSGNLNGYYVQNKASKRYLADGKMSDAKFQLTATEIYDMF